MGFVKDTFFGGDEKKAGRRAEREGRRAQAGIEAAGEEAIGGLQPFETEGRAFQLQQAQSGALGPEAQAQAFQDFQESPGQQFLREEGLRFIESGAGARGGLGGGERLRELVKFGTGLASQDFGAQFGRLGQVAQTGLGVARDIGSIGRGTAAGVGAAGIGAVDAFSQGRLAGSAAARAGIQQGAGAIQGGITGGGGGGGFTGGLTGALSGAFGG